MNNTMKEGNHNTGDHNTGNFNKGNFNKGDFNSGCFNSGDCNKGDYNKSNHNKGNCNSGDYNAGVFCTDTPRVMFFDKPSDMTFDKWYRSDAYNLLSELRLTTWICADEMTADEKQMHPDYPTTGGYLRVTSMNEAWRDLWINLSDDEKQAFYDLPNFDVEKFEKITGIPEEEIGQDRGRSNDLRGVSQTAEGDNVLYREGQPSIGCFKVLFPSGRMCE